MTERPTEKQIELMQHALGINENRREPWRNYFFVSEPYAEWEILVNNGYAESQKAPRFTGGGITYHCTEKGRVAAIVALPEPKKLTRSQQEYADYIKSEYSEYFTDWLGIDVPQREYSYAYETRGFVRLKSRRATGEYCKTLKEAKASYKAALPKRQTYSCGKCGKFVSESDFNYYVYAGHPCPHCKDFDYSPTPLGVQQDAN